VLVPDIAGWRRDRMPRFPDVAYFELAPDWVCEVVAPKNVSLVRIRKMPCYAAHGVGYAWIVDRSGVVRAVPLEGTDIKLARLWLD
jgi:Uma2 family endonuclease